MWTNIIQCTYPLFTLLWQQFHHICSHRRFPQLSENTLSYVLQNQTHTERWLCWSFTVQQYIPLSSGLLWRDEWNLVLKYLIPCYQAKSKLGKVYIEKVDCYTKQLKWECRSGRLILDQLRHTLYPNLNLSHLKTVRVTKWDCVTEGSCVTKGSCVIKGGCVAKGSCVTKFIKIQ